MGFEVYLQCFDKGQPAGISRQIIRAVCGSALNDLDSQYWYLGYDDEQNACEILVSYLGNDSDLIESFCVLRPSADERMWDAMLTIMKLGNVVLYWPGMESPLIGDESVLRNLPSGMVEALGTPVCVHSGAEILRRFKA